jgi:hypothetical protein
MIRRRMTPLASAALIAGVLAAGGCSEEIHSAQWYMAHGPELQDKLTECKKYPSLNDSDQNCKNAMEAFMTLVTATAQQAEKAQQLQQQQQGNPPAQPPPAQPPDSH